MTATVPSAADLTLEDVRSTGEFTIGCMSELNRSGDMRTMWDSRNEAEVEVARKQFNKLTKEGYLAYRAEGKEGRQGTQMREFDPRAERIILVKPLVGG